MGFLTGSSVLNQVSRTSTVKLISDSISFWKSVLLQVSWSLNSCLLLHIKSLNWRGYVCTVKINKVLYIMLFSTLMLFIFCFFLKCLLITAIVIDSSWVLCPPLNKVFLLSSSWWAGSPATTDWFMVDPWPIPGSFCLLLSEYLQFGAELLNQVTSSCRDSCLLFPLVLFSQLLFWFREIAW